MRSSVFSPRAPVARTVADAYLYTVTRWAPRVEFDLSHFPNINAFMGRMNARPKVQEALKAEGLP